MFATQPQLADALLDRLVGTAIFLLASLGFSFGTAPKS
jgi:hypothetical protein